MLSGGLKIGDRVFIKESIAGLEGHSKLGVVEQVDGAYILVRPDGLGLDRLVELYPVELEKVTGS